jgi:hypothetical protein
MQVLAASIAGTVAVKMFGASARAVETYVSSFSRE